MKNSILLICGAVFLFSCSSIQELESQCSSLTQKLHSTEPGFTLRTINHTKADDVQLALGKHEGHVKNIVQVHYQNDQEESICTCLFDEDDNLLNPSGEIEGKTVVPFVEYESVYYKFHDASVEPKWHRSYSIELNMAEGKYVVTSYSDTLVEKELEVTHQSIFELNDYLSSLEGMKRLSHSDATGGTAEQLHIVYNDGKVEEAMWDNEADASIRALIDYMKQVVTEQGIELGKAP